MSKLVDDLKQQHKVIADTLSKVKSLGVTSDEGQKTLLAAKNGLLAHLNKEDKELYPVLNKAAESDSGLKNTLDFYAKDMDTISKAALEFFEKYSTGGSGLEFAKDFGTLFATLSLRINKEESILYKKYDELMQ
ncbi:MAG: hemerythrin domain-containing protein [Candidatus Brocadiaceae bacterium]|nr:hemerythrin domain-containing protein [Candidatus Brocadiaceae bacterium]